MKKPVLSICYPTYNRGKTIFESVSRTLRYMDDDIEVVVLDNCSEDDTWELLSKIDDERLSVYRNDKNIGTLNLVYVLKKARADYALLLSDEDYVIIDNIKKVISEINDNSDCDIMRFSALSFGEEMRSCTYENEKTDKGFWSINKIFMNTYMSGFVYSTKKVRNLSESKMAFLERLNKGGSYIFLYLAFFLIDDSSLYTSATVLTNHYVEASHDISTYYITGDHVYSPMGRLKFMKLHLEALCFCTLSEMGRVNLLYKTIFAFWGFALGWIAICYQEKSNDQNYVQDFHKLELDSDFDYERTIQDGEEELIRYADSIGYIRKEIVSAVLSVSEDLNIVRENMKRDYIEKSKDCLEIYYNES